MAQKQRPVFAKERPEEGLRHDAGGEDDGHQKHNPQL